MIYEYDLNPYPRKLWVTFDATAKELNEMFPEGDTNGIPFKEFPETINAVVECVRRLKPDPKGGYLIRFKDNNPDFGIIAHESGHVCFELYDYIYQNNIKDQEPFCYLLEYICNIVVKLISDYKEKAEVQ